MTDQSATTPRPRRSLRRRLLFLLVIVLALESLGWVGDYIFGYRFRLLASLSMMRLETEPIPALSDTSNDRPLIVRSPDDGPGPAEPYRIGGVWINRAGPWLLNQTVTPESVLSDDQQRVFIIGGSASYGFPYRYGDTFAGQLQQRLGHRDYRVLNASRVGWTSGELAPLVDQAVRFYRPQVIVLFTGNNEWFHWRPVDTQQPAGQQAPRREKMSQASVDTLKFLAHSRCLSAIEHVLVKWHVSRQQARQDESRQQESRDRFEAHHELTGVRYSVEMPLDPGQYDPAQWEATRQRYLDTLEANLERMIRTAQQQDVRVLLLNVPFKYRLSPAWKHRQPMSFDPAEQQAVQRSVQKTLAELDQEKYEAALEEVESALTRDPLPAVLHYLKGECLVGLERPVEAEAAFAQSRECMIGNLGSRLSVNRVIDRVAERTGATLVDVREMFDAYGHARQRYFNIDLIHDDCHPTPLGHQLIAEKLVPLILKSGMGNGGEPQ